MTHLSRLGSCLCCVLALSAPAFAQAPSNAPAASGNTIKLSEFEVTAEPERGYVASETMTGSRVATRIIDLPYTVNVLTSEFFEDFAMFELGDNITQIGSFTGLDIGGGFTLRGFSSTSQLRDGFYRLGRYGSSNIDRMEIIKGSNAAIYGRTSPGGMVNMISKQPKDRPYSKLTLNYGSYDTQRGVLESTGPLFNNRLGKTSYILTLSQYQRGFEGQYARNHNDEYYLAVKHTFADNSTLLVSGEYFHQTRHAPTSGAPLIIDAKGTSTNTDDEAIGYAKKLAGYNAYGPNSELNRGNVGFNAIYEKRFNPVWSVRGAGNYYRARRWDYNQNTGFGTITINNSSGAGPSTARGATPSKGLIMEDGGGIQADALAHAWFANHTIENRFLVTLDFNDYYRWDPTWDYAQRGGTVNGAPTVRTDSVLLAWDKVRTVALDSNLAPATALSYFPDWFQWGKEYITRLTRRRTTVLGGLVREQAAFLNGRLLTFAGARFDAVRFQERDYAAVIAGYAKGEMIYKRVNQLKPNFGVNYKLTPSLRVFANYSESYFVNQTDNPSSFTSANYKPETAEGYDYGFKGEFLQGRLTFTASGFYATRENVNVSDTFEDPIGSGNYVTTSRRDGDQLVRGFELDANWRATDELSLLASWGHVYSIYTDFGSANPLSVGRRVNGVAPENGSISARYSPRQGSLKGFSANLGWTYVASTPSESPNSGDTYTTDSAGQRVLTRTTRQWALRTPSYGIWNLGLRYTFRTAGRWDHTVGVNLNNATDVDYLKSNKQLGDRRSIFFTYTIGLDRS